ncbi:type IV secretion system protein [Bartonella sp. AU55XJBT]|uniref:type IV secretion system protein n=1 Tax=Bartonella sp. AU55XJBT TaxID=3019091 RepID=UPI00235FC3A6|nr:type IV secretion system protein [Bartonella sp. AU55XJBT]
MKKWFIKTGMITLLVVLNLTLTSNFSWGSGNQDSTVQTPFSKAEYLKIIELLNQQIKTAEDQIEKAKKVHQSITGNRIQKPTIGDNKVFFLQDSSIYPSPHTDYQNLNAQQFQNYNYFKHLMLSIQREERSNTFRQMQPRTMRAIINTRLKYSGIVDKAVSLQTFQDAEKRFTQIVNFLNEIDKTKDLREVFELQTRIKNMSAMLQNEYAKLQMVRNLSNNEETLIEIQKRKLYEKIISSENRNVPNVRFN